jgi:hypothetical protein
MRQHYPDELHHATWNSDSSSRDRFVHPKAQFERMDKESPFALNGFNLLATRLRAS